MWNTRHYINPIREYNQICLCVINFFGNGVLLKRITTSTTVQTYNRRITGVLLNV